MPAGPVAPTGPVTPVATSGTLRARRTRWPYVSADAPRRSRDTLRALGPVAPAGPCAFHEIIRACRGHLGVPLIVTFESVFVTELRHAEYLTTGALEDSALAMAIPPPTSATAPAVVATVLHKLHHSPLQRHLMDADQGVLERNSLASAVSSIYDVSDATGAVRKLFRSTRPSSLPSSVDMARSGWGIRPTTLPRSLAMPAISPRDPLGLSL